MDDALTHLKRVMQGYQMLSDEAWQTLQPCLRASFLNKGQTLYHLAKVPKTFAFVHKGLMRAYVMDEKGHEFNKNFFAEGRFPGCMSALIKNEPSFLAIEALEDCELIEIDFVGFRRAMFNSPELMKYHIHYLEHHWLIEKEPKEIGYIQFEAKQRYLTFIDEYKHVLSRLSQYHIASYLGITPTQLSRIKKDLK